MSAGNICKAKINNKPVWVEGFYFTKTDKDGVLRHRIKTKTEEHFIDPKTLCCFTRKTDINNKKIFTSDIVVSKPANFQYEVIWNSRKYCYELVLMTTRKSYSLGNKRLQVIGNVYDNYDDVFINESPI